MSSQDKDVYGECQIEVDFMDEGDLQERFHSCKKNPTHETFVSLESLKLYHLPESHRTHCALHYIRHVSQFTVKLTCYVISPDRPCTCGNKQLAGGIRCTCPRGNLRHVGSGFVTGLAGPDQLKPDVIDATKTYFILVTAAHVVFDTSEAQKTDIEFFYDDPDDRSSVRKARGVEVLTANFEADFSEVLCVTEEKEVADILNELNFTCPEDKLESEDIVLKKEIPGIFNNHGLVVKDDFLKIILDKIVYATLHECDESCNYLMKIMRKKGHGNLMDCIRKLISRKRYLHHDSKIFEILEEIIKLIQRPLHPHVIEWSELIKLDYDYYFKQNELKLPIFCDIQLKFAIQEEVSEDLAIHISHPHGTSKKVTFGKMISADTRHGHYQLIYSLDTCKGSSGGPVFVIPSNIYEEDIYKAVYFDYINKKACYIFKNQPSKSISCVPHARYHGNNLNSSSSWTVYF